MKKNYVRTHDLDWFFIISGKPIHVASVGGDLPKGIKSLKLLREWQKKVENITSRVKVELNRAFIAQQVIQKDYNYFNDKDFDPDIILQENDFIKELDYYGLSVQEKMYYNSFVSMAIRGFYSFDRNLHDEKHETYHIVAKAIHPNKDLLKMLKEAGVPSIETNDINLDDDMDQLNNIELVKIIDNIMNSAR